MRPFPTTLPPPPPAMRGRQSVGTLTIFRQKYLSFINVCCLRRFIEAERLMREFND
jgi:hypothetical protein